MKKLFIGLMALALAFTAAVSLTGCGPTAGLDELTLDEITAADISGTYSLVTKTTLYNSDGSVKSSSESDPAEVAGLVVKADMAASAIAIGLTSTVTSNANGRVCANKKFTKIVIYSYTRSNGKLTSEVIKTYRKK